jgi:hypothetical protein
MLRQTGVSIDPLTDVDMLLFLESNIRGGVSFIGQRWCETDSQSVNTDPAALTGGDKLLYIDAVRWGREM